MNKKLHEDKLFDFIEFSTFSIRKMLLFIIWYSIFIYHRKEVDVKLYWKQRIYYRRINIG